MNQRIRVKLPCPVPTPQTVLRQFPNGIGAWGQCDFEFNADAREYDWLVVYNDLPSVGSERRSTRCESLACPRENTLLITTEPSSVKVYGRRFISQFGHVLSSQEPWIIRHPRQIHSQPALAWLYAYNMPHCTAHSFDEMIAHTPLDKSKLISTVCSAKRQRHTLHRKRYNFTWELKSLLPELDVFGHGVRVMDDKAEALDEYRYHVAVENHVAEHHWTEKLADAFLGCTLPFYFGCPNAADYFPSESFIPIDILNPQEAARLMRDAMNNNEYERRLPHILEARRRVLYEYNLYAVLSKLIEDRHDPSSVAPGGLLYSRRQSRRRAPVSALFDFVDKVIMHIPHRSFALPHSSVSAGGRQMKPASDKKSR